MHRHCLYCAADLQTNPVLETFPVGTRLAFDAKRGRLWVVCRRCEQWNLTPLEVRWEAIEDLERLYRETPLRVASSEIGMARHRGGLDLVRIGAPLRPEFAAWRYGDQFGRRQRRTLLRWAAGATVLGGLGVGSAALGGLGALQVGLNLYSVWHHAIERARPAAHVPIESGASLSLSLDAIGAMKLRPGEGSSHFEGADPWHLTWKTAKDPAATVLQGDDARRVLRHVMPVLNQGGAGRRDVESAVGELEMAGAPERLIGQTEARARKQGAGYRTLGGLPTPLRLALEMAVHEEAELNAAEGELSWLESAWREAESTAVILDNLTIPDRIHLQFEAMKAKRTGRGATD